jgi:hypothetical protein
MIGVLAERLVKKVTAGNAYGKLSTVIFVLTITGTYYLSSINVVISTRKYKQIPSKQMAARGLHITER